MILAAPAPIRRPALLVNPNAWGNSRRPQQREALRRAFSSLGEAVETKDRSALARLFRRWRAEGIDLIAISGGDGTFHIAVEELLRAWAGAPLPRILPLHGGTIGAIARSVGSLDPLGAVVSLSRALATRELLPERTLPTLQVGERVAFNFGIGAFSSITGEYAAGPERGPWAVRRLTLRVIGSTLVGGELSRRAFRRWQGEVELDGAPIPTDRFVGLYASTVDQMGAFSGFRNLQVPPGHFRVLRLNASTWELVRSLVPFTLGWNGGLAPGVRLLASQRISLRAKEPFVFMVDGEFYRQEQPLQLQLGPALSVVQA